MATWPTCRLSLEWLANIANPKTRLAYSIDVGEFGAFAGGRGVSAASIRRKLSALSYLVGAESPRRWIPL